MDFKSRIQNNSTSLVIIIKEITNDKPCYTVYSNSSYSFAAQ